MNLRRIGLGLLVSVVCLYFVLRGVQWGEVWRHLSEVDLPLFGLSMLLMLVAYFLMTWRWQHLLDPLEVPMSPSDTGGSLPAPASPGGMRSHVSLLNLYGKMLTGYFFNAFFPARAGDLVRAYLLGRKTGLRKTTILATIVIEKAFDGIVLLVLLLLSLVVLPSVGAAGVGGLDPDLLAWVAGAGIVVAIAGLGVFYMFSGQIARFTERVVSRLPLPDRLKRLPVRLIDTFASGMHVFKSPLPLVSAAAISVFVWLAVALMFLAGLMSFRTPFPDQLTGIAGLFFITGLVNLGLLVPALPGNVGTYEALVVAAMAFFRVDKELAVAFALIFHVGQIVVTLAVGLFAFWAQNMSLAEMRPVEAAAEREAERSLEEIERGTL
ncbi:MAG TPA: lysylphosphatidylglycerol synthase transmembrane domain-containing protein [Chloroflexia bacterium]|nr:lysylphosphatidylglycerol synthase transmembrane domain-containing protein [Chloroflexia bacterium]